MLDVEFDRNSAPLSKELGPAVVEAAAAEEIK